MSPLTGGGWDTAKVPLTFAGRWRDCCYSGEFEPHETGCHTLRDAMVAEVSDEIREYLAKRQPGMSLRLYIASVVVSVAAVLLVVMVVTGHITLSVTIR